MSGWFNILLCATSSVGSPLQPRRVWLCGQPGCRVTSKKRVLEITFEDILVKICWWCNCCEHRKQTLFLLTRENWCESVWKLYRGCFWIYRLFLDCRCYVMFQNHNKGYTWNEEQMLGKFRKMRLARGKSPVFKTLMFKKLSNVLSRDRSH